MSDTLRIASIVQGARKGLKLKQFGGEQLTIHTVMAAIEEETRHSEKKIPVLPAPPQLFKPRRPSQLPLPDYTLKGTTDQQGHANCSVPGSSSPPTTPIKQNASNNCKWNYVYFRLEDKTIKALKASADSMMRKCKS